MTQKTAPTRVTAGMTHPSRRSAAFLLLAMCLPDAAQAQSQSSFRSLGRYARQNGELVFGWPGSGVEGRCVAAQIRARIRSSDDDVLDLAIDDERSTLRVESGAHDYPLFQDAAPREHVIVLTRKSEAGLTTIQSLDIDGHWLAPPSHAHRMLIIGDSISAGRGAAGADRYCRATVEANAPLASFGVLAARRFDAEFQLLALSGRGLIRNFDGAAGPVMPDMIGAALPFRREIAWDQARFRPDLVVINLGANDFTGAGPGPGFAGAYRGLLERVRELYPETAIVAAVGPDAAFEHATMVAAAVAAFNAARGEHVLFIALPMARTGRVWGCEWHPGLATHAVMAADLEALIGRELGWVARA